MTQKYKKKYQEKIIFRFILTKVSQGKIDDNKNGNKLAGNKK